MKHVYLYYIHQYYTLVSYQYNINKLLCNQSYLSQVCISKNQVTN